MADLGTKTLSLWIQALQVWRINRKEAGLDGKLPRKGTPEHKEIMVIMDHLRSGDMLVDPTVIKVKSKPTIKKPKAARAPTLTVHASTHRTGKSTAKGRRVATKRAEIDAKQAEKQLKVIEDDLKEARKDFSKEVEDTQKKMIKLIARLQSGKPLSEGEKRKVEEEMAGLTMTLKQKEEIVRVKQDLELKTREAHRDMLEENEKQLQKEKADMFDASEKAKAAAEKDRVAAFDAAERVRLASERDRTAEALLNDKIPGIKRDLTTKELKAVWDLNQYMESIVNGRSAPGISTPVKPINKGSTTIINSLIKKGAIFPTPDSDISATLSEKFDKTSKAFPVPYEGRWYYIDDKIPDIKPVERGEELPLLTPIPPPEPPIAHVSVDPAKTVDDVIATGTTSTEAPVKIEDVAPTLGDMATKTGTADPEKLSEVAKAVIDTLDPTTTATPIDEGSGLRLSVEPYLLPGSRNSGPINLGRGYTGPKITAGMLHPGSRNTHPDMLGGAQLNLGTNRTNKTAIKLARQLQLEVARLDKLALEGIPVLVGNV